MFQKANIRTRFAQKMFFAKEFFGENQNQLGVSLNTSNSEVFSTSPVSTLMCIIHINIQGLMCHIDELRLDL